MSLTSYIGDELEISLCRVEKKVYGFWFAFDNYTLFGNSQFISRQSAIEGNIEGTLGIFGAQLTSSHYIKLEYPT